MPIPELNAHGLLPEGIFTCALEEIQTRFGMFQGSDQRPKLFERLKELLAEVRRTGMFAAIVIDGSFTTAIAEPNDIDLILVLPSNHDWRRDVGPDEYNLLRRHWLRRRFGFDIFIALEHDQAHEDLIAFFSKVRNNPNIRKGMLRILL